MISRMNDCAEADLTVGDKLRVFRVSELRLTRQKDVRTDIVRKKLIPESHKGLQQVMESLRLSIWTSTEKARQRVLQ